MSLQELHYDIQRQMALTEEMTEQRLKTGAASYLQMDNGEESGRGGGGLEGRGGGVSRWGQRWTYVQWEMGGECEGR